MRMSFTRISVLAMSTIVVPATVLAVEPEAEVVERNDQGRATKVKVGEEVYDVCSPGKPDGCINPRDVGIDEGRRAIDYWPGKPASEKNKPAPARRENAPPANAPQNEGVMKPDQPG